MVLNVCCSTLMLLGMLQLTASSHEICDMQLPSSSQDIYGCPSEECKMGKCKYHCENNNRMKLPISLNITDPENGTLEIVYKLNNEKITEFTMILYVDEMATPEECEKGDNLDWKLHSERSRQLIWCDNPDCIRNCENTMTVVFDYVYSSCYYVNIERRYYINSERRKTLQSLTSCRQMLKTNLVKKKLSEMKPKVAPKYYPGEGASYIAHIDGNPKIIWIILSSQFRQSRDVCQKCLNSHSCCVYERDFSRNNSFICEDHNDSKAECGLGESHFPGLESVHCLFHGVNPGNYCISIMYSDDRCAETDLSVWGEGSCHWITSLNVTSLPDVIELPVLKPDESYNLYCLIIAVAFLFIMILSLIVFIFWRKDPDRPTWPSVVDERVRLFKLGTPKVLILSPHSCQPFMDCVARLADVLRSKNCEVFDYWDPDQYLSVSRSPNFWLESLMRDKSVQIVVVAGECSRLLEKNRNLNYINPHCLDNLFICGLEYIKTFVTDSYEKVYVVSFNGEQDTTTGDKTPGLVFINPLTVFTLPLHLEKLILALHSADGIGYCISMKSLEIQKFISAVESYSEFLSSNLDYLNDLFVGRTDDVCLDHHTKNSDVSIMRA